MANPPHSLLEAAYLYYYATDTAFVENAEELGLLKRRLTELIGNAIVLADQAKFDVFYDGQSTVLARIEGDVSMPELFFFVLSIAKPLAGINPTEDRVAGRGVGVVML